MLEPPERQPAPPPPAPSPFDPGGVGSAVRPGCGKPLAIGCGLASLLVLAAALFFLTKAHDILRWTIEAMQPEIERRLPEETSAAERRRLREAFARAADRAASGELDPAALQRLQRRFIAVAGEEKLSREELERFLEALEAFAAAAPPQGGEGAGARPPPEAAGGTG